MSILPYSTKYNCQYGLCEHCKHLDHRKCDPLLPHYAYTLMMVLTDQSDPWKPSHETLVKNLVPYFTLNTEHIESIATHFHMDLKTVQYQYEHMYKEYDTLCRQYLEQSKYNYLLDIFDDIIESEREFSGHDHDNGESIVVPTYPYQLVRYGIVTYDNWKSFSHKDLEMICEAHHVSGVNVGDVMKQYSDSIKYIRYIYPKIMNNPIIHSLWEQLINMDMSQSLPMPIPSRHVKIESDVIEDVTLFEMDEDRVTPMTPMTPMRENSPHTLESKTFVDFIPPHLITHGTGFTPPLNYRSFAFSV